MAHFVQLIAPYVTAGILRALVAPYIIITYEAAKVFNFAQGFIFWLPLAETTVLPYMTSTFLIKN